MTYSLLGAEFGTRQVLFAVLAAASGLVLNLFPLPLFFGVDFLLGSVITLVFARVAGLGPVMVVAALISAPTLALWGHPWAIAIFTAEAAFVVLAQARYRSHDLTLIDAVYWLTIGIPLVALFYYGVLGMDATATTLIGLKQLLNGIFNALIASALVNYLPIESLYRGVVGQKPRTISLKTLIFHALAGFVLVPAMLFFGLHGRDEFDHFQSLAAQHVKVATMTAAARISLRHELAISALDAVARTAIDGGGARPVEDTEAKLAALGGIMRFTVFQSDGTVVSSWQLASGDFSANPAPAPIPTSRMTSLDRPDLSFDTVETGETATELVRISWTVTLGDGETGSAEALVQPNVFWGADTAGGTDTLNRILVSDQLAANGRRGPKLGTLGNGAQDWWVHFTAAGDAPVMVRWRSAHFETSVPFPPYPAWSLRVSASAEPYVDALRIEHIHYMLVTALVSLLALLASAILSSRIVAPLATLARTTQDLPGALDSERAIGRIPRSRISEVADLAENFGLMAEHVQRILASSRHLTAETKTMVETAGAPIFGIDTQRRINLWNVKIAAITGYGADEVMGRSLIELTAPSNVCTPMVKAIGNGLKGETASGVQILILTKDGDVADLLFNTTARRNWRGEVVGVFGVGQDLTERKRAERALTRSEVRYADLVENAFDMILYVTPDGRFGFVNQAFLATLEYTQDELGKKTLLDVIEKRYQRHCRKMFERALQGESHQKIEAAFVTKSGLSVEVEGSLTPQVVDGKVVAVHGIFRDVTERNRHEKALRESAAGLANAQRIARLGNWEWDIAANELCWSDEIYRIFGVEPQAFGATYEAFMSSVHADDRAAVQASVDKALAGKEAYDIDHRIVLPDGEIRVVHEQAEITFDASGKPAHMSGTVQDITERKLAQAQVIQASKLATLGEMATSVAHEVNQPLNVIRMAAGNSLRRLAKGTADDAYLAEKLERIDSQTQRAAAIIDHMRTFGRKAEEKPSAIDPREAIRGALDLMGEQLRLARIEVSLDIRSASAKVLGHRLQLEQVFLNLLGNARDAIEENGDNAPGQIRIGVYADDDAEVRITVADSGGGIPEPVAERIFEPFFTTKEMGKGTGLGLSVSYGIIRDMGGTIEAANTEDGALFTIRLPLAAEARTGPISVTSLGEADWAACEKSFD